LLVYTLVINKCLNGNIFLLNVLLSSVVILCIKTKSLLIFYIFFELRVIPITLIVFLFGYQPEKLQASLFLLIYTVVRRLPLLLFIVTHERHHFITIVRSVIISVPITMGFIVKTPMFLLHTWLPKAHVEAPVGGSIVLAGVLLKLGSYGLLLFLPLIKLNTLLSFYYGIGLIGSSLGALICLRQGDLKLLIAYSSVVHMGVVTLGFIRATELGYSCGLIMVLGHGLSSPFIFAFSY
jgi:NADH:ubiquinone oxidoreductase subunit 4 (subunit M)